MQEAIFAAVAETQTASSTEEDTSISIIAGSGQCTAVHWVRRYPEMGASTDSIDGRRTWIGGSRGAGVFGLVPLFVVGRAMGKAPKPPRCPSRYLTTGSLPDVLAL